VLKKASRHRERGRGKKESVVGGRGGRTTGEADSCCWKKLVHPVWGGGKSQKRLKWSTQNKKGLLTHPRIWGGTCLEDWKKKGEKNRVSGSVGKNSEYKKDGS